MEKKNDFLKLSRKISAEELDCFDRKENEINNVKKKSKLEKYDEMIFESYKNGYYEDRAFKRDTRNSLTKKNSLSSWKEIARKNNIDIGL